MNDLPKRLKSKLELREANSTLRRLTDPSGRIDFSSNDYLGFSKSDTIFKGAHQMLLDHKMSQNGASGSRLLTGNHGLYGEVEEMITKFHKSESALIFNSGYDANLGFFSSVPQRGDIILYDEFCHASIRDGIQLSNAKSYKFKHNDLCDLQNLLERHSECVEVYVVTESVFSMDGDTPDLNAISELGKKHRAHLIIDEAHAIGLFGTKGNGIVSELQLEDAVFARIITFGKGLGCHGAAILGSANLKQYLVNFSRSFIYTTGLPPHSLATIKLAYLELKSTLSIEKLQQNIKYFKNEMKTLGLENNFIRSNSAIHCCVVPGNEIIKNIAQKLQHKGFDVKPILSPTVAEGQERLRFCLHSYNSESEIKNVLIGLATFVLWTK